MLIVRPSIRASTTSGVSVGKIERANLQIPVVQQLIATCQIDQLSGPRSDCLAHLLPTLCGERLIPRRRVGG